jgi:hypothetical protein
MRLSVIIPSRRAPNLIPCVDAVRRCERTIPIVVVSDGLDLRYCLGQWGGEWASRQAPLQVLEGIEPFIYARNINLGIRAAAAEYRPEAFILLNDDALLMTPGGFTRLAQCAREHPDYGVISAVTNLVGNEAQLARNVGSFREESKMLCFVCVLITAETLATVGPLDERFSAYGWEDNDFCRRCRLAGIRLGISDLCFVDHGSLQSTFRGNPTAGGDITAGSKIYREKWGDLA